MYWIIENYWQLICCSHLLSMKMNKIKMIIYDKVAFFCIGAYVGNMDLKLTRNVPPQDSQCYREWPSKDLLGFQHRHWPCPLSHKTRHHHCWKKKSHPHLSAQSAFAKHSCVNIDKRVRNKTYCRKDGLSDDTVFFNYLHSPAVFIVLKRSEENAYIHFHMFRFYYNFIRRFLKHCRGEKIS